MHKQPLTISNSGDLSEVVRKSVCSRERAPPPSPPAPSAVQVQGAGAKEEGSRVEGRGRPGVAWPVVTDLHGSGHGQHCPMRSTTEEQKKAENPLNVQAWRT